MHEPTVDWKKYLKLFGYVAVVSAAIVIYILRVQRHERLCAEEAELLKEFRVISDPFTRPKLYRHKDTQNLNPGAKLPDDEVLFLVTSEGNVVFVNTLAAGSIPTDTNGSLTKRVTTSSGSSVYFSLNDNRIKLLAKDLVFEPRLDPCFAKASTMDRYSWVPGWVHQDKQLIELLGKTVAEDNNNRPYLYRLTIENVEGSIAGAQLTALKQTFRLAELIRETGK
jgi:hypothetical protein